MRPPALLVAAIALAGCALPSPPLATPYYEEILSGAEFTTLVIEVDHAPGYAPSDAARAHLLATLRNVTSKAEVRFDLQSTLEADATKRWTAEDLVALEQATRTTAHEAPVAVMHVLYPAGRYGEGGAAGVTISGPVLGPVAVFLDEIRSLRTDLGPVPLLPGAVERVERATLLHEAGHAMGLVDNGLPMVKAREDPEHEGHTTNPRSVMFWRVESIAGLRDYLLSDGSVPDVFDADDRADFRSAGGR